MSGPDVTGVEEYAEKAARDADPCPRCGNRLLQCVCSREELERWLLDRLIAEARAVGAAEERERIAAAIEACICNYGPNTEGPERECFRHGEEAAAFYLGHAARIARGEAT